MWREIVRFVAVHQQTISVQEGCAPPPAARPLHRSLSVGSDGEGEGCRAKEIQAERHTTWQNAQTTRRKYARASVVKFQKWEGLQKWFEDQKTAYDFVGKVGESHWVFVFSADTFGPESAEPWKNTKHCKDTELAAVLAWMGRQNGPTDVLLSLDGRNVTDRKTISTAFESFRNSCDLWLVYEPSWRFGRRIAWASKREVGFLSLPLPRTAITTKEHTTKAADWAPSTHASYYQGVPAVLGGPSPP